MYDIYTQLALQDHFVKRALYNQLAREALIKYASIPIGYLLGYLLGRPERNTSNPANPPAGASAAAPANPPAGASAAAPANPPAGASAAAPANPPAGASGGASVNPPVNPSGNAPGNAVTRAVTKKGLGFLKHLQLMFRRHPFRATGTAAGLLGLGYLGPKFLSGLYHFILPNNTSVPPPHIYESDLLHRLSPGVGLGALAGAGLAGFSSLNSTDPRAREAAINNILLGALLGGAVGGGASYLGYL